MYFIYMYTQVVTYLGIKLWNKVPTDRTRSRTLVRTADTNTCPDRGSRTLVRTADHEAIKSRFYLVTEVCELHLFKDKSKVCDVTSFFSNFGISFVFKFIAKMYMYIINSYMYLWLFLNIAVSRSKTNMNKSCFLIVL